MCPRTEKLRLFLLGLGVGLLLSFLVGTWLWKLLLAAGLNALALLMDCCRKNRHILVHARVYTSKTWQARPAGRERPPERTRS